MHPLQFTPSLPHSSHPLRLPHRLSTELSPASIHRVSQCMQVHALGFHEYVRTLRTSVEGTATAAGRSITVNKEDGTEQQQSLPTAQSRSRHVSSIIANIVRFLLHLLDECVPDGSLHSTMKLAQIDSTQTRKERELMLAREREIHQLISVETGLLSEVNDIERRLREVQTQRQESEDTRLEAYDAIDTQHALVQESSDELQQAEITLQQWSARYSQSQDRLKMILEDVKEEKRKLWKVKEVQRKTQEEYVQTNQTTTQISHESASLLTSTATLQEKQRRLTERNLCLLDEIKKIEYVIMQLQEKLILFNGLVGDVTMQAMRWMKERMRIVAEVERIQGELNVVIDRELLASSRVTTHSTSHLTLSTTLTDTLSSYEKLHASHTQLTVENERTIQMRKRKEVQIEEEKKRREEAKVKKQVKYEEMKEKESIYTALQADISLDSTTISEVDQKYSSAQAALQSLKDLIEHTKQENKSFQRDIQVLNTQRSELLTSLETHTYDITQHDSLVHTHIAKLKQDVQKYETEIVDQAKKSKEYQEEAVKEKGEQLLLTTELNTSQQDLSTASQVTLQSSNQLKLTTTISRNASTALKKLNEEVERAIVIRGTGRKTLDLALEGHKVRMAALHAKRAEIEAQVRAKQASTLLKREEITKLQSERVQLEAKHQEKLHTIQSAEQTRDAAFSSVCDRHLTGMTEAQTEQKRLLSLSKDRSDSKEKLQLEYEKLKKDLEEMRVRKQVEMEKVADGERKLNLQKKENAERSALVRDLSASVSQLAHQHEQHIHDNQSIHHLFSYTQLTNSELERRLAIYAAIDRERTLMSTCQEVQTDAVAVQS